MERVDLTVTALVNEIDCERKGGFLVQIEDSNGRKKVYCELTKGLSNVEAMIYGIAYAINKFKNNFEFRIITPILIGFKDTYITNATIADIVLQYADENGHHFAGEVVCGDTFDKLNDVLFKFILKNMDTYGSLSVTEFDDIIDSELLESDDQNEEIDERKEEGFSEKFIEFFDLLIDGESNDTLAEKLNLDNSDIFSMRKILDYYILQKSFANNIIDEEEPIIEHANTKIHIVTVSGEDYRYTNAGWVDSLNMIAIDSISHDCFNELFNEENLNQFDDKELYKMLALMNNNEDVKCINVIERLIVLRGEKTLDKDITKYFSLLSSAYRKAGQSIKNVNMYEEYSDKYDISYFDKTFLLSVAASYCDVGKVSEAKALMKIILKNYGKDMYVMNVLKRIELL